MLSVSVIIVRSLEVALTVQAPSTAPTIAVVRVSAPRGLPGADGTDGQDGADGQDGSPYPLATQLEMEAGTVTDPRTVSPSLIAAAIAALSSGAPLDLPLSLLNGGTGADSAPAARVNLGVEEVVAAVAQVVSIFFGTDDAASLGGAYIDISSTTETVRFWFDDGLAMAPEVPGGGRLIAVGLGSVAADHAAALAAAADAESGFTASVDGAECIITNVLSGAAFALNSGNAYLSINVTTAGADSYRRLTILDGRQLTNVVAASLVGGYVAEDFSLATHSHSYLQITNRPLFAQTSVDLVTSSTVLSNLLSLPAVSGKTYLFFATGTLLTSTSTLEGSSIAINGPSSSGIAADFTLPTNGIGGETNGNVTAFETKFTNVSGPGSSARGRWTASGRFVCSASGNFAIRVSAETGGANSVTWRAGSILILCPIN